MLPNHQSDVIVRFGALLARKRTSAFVKGSGRRRRWVGE
jgi:hypothetical protein